MATKDILLQSIRIKRLGLRIIPREPFIRMRDIQTPIRSTLERTKHTTPRTRLAQSNIQKHLEWPWAVLLLLLGQSMAAIGLKHTLILVGKADLGKGTTGDEETCGIGGRPIFEAMLDAIAGQLRGVSGGKDDVTLDLGVDDLADLPARN